MTSCGEAAEWNASTTRPPPGIPRILHQTFFSTKSLPEILEANVRYLRRSNPGWEHHLYDDSDIEDFIAATYGRDMLRRYNRISRDYGAARADLFRYLAVYHSGGVYLDIKSSAARPLDEVIRPDDSFILSQWRNRRGEVHNGWGLHPELWKFPGGEFQQWFIAAAPRHPFLGAVIEQVLANIERYNPLRDGVGFPAVMRLTGPVAYTRAIVPLLDRYPHRRVPDESALSLDYSVLKGQTHRGLFGGHYARRRTPLVDARPGILPVRLLGWLQIARDAGRRIATSGQRAVVDTLAMLGLRSRKS